MTKKIILITTLAEYQTAFWIEVAREIVKNGIQVIFVSFDDRSTDLLLENNFKVYYLKRSNFVNDYSDKTLEDVLKDLNIGPDSKIHLVMRLAGC